MPDIPETTKKAVARASWFHSEMRVFSEKGKKLHIIPSIHADLLVCCAKPSGHILSHRNCTIDVVKVQISRQRPRPGSRGQGQGLSKHTTTAEIKICCTSDWQDRQWTDYYYTVVPDKLL